MLRLTQKAWNNVVIFAMLFMVYLFTISNDMLNDGETPRPEKEPLFPPFSVVMSVDFSIVKLDRIGQDWRVTGGPEQRLSTPKTDSDKLLSELLTIMETWSNLEAIPFVAEPATDPYIVAIQLAGEDKKRVYQLYDFEDGVLFKLNANWFFVDGIAVEELYPVGLIK
jgi:hypothetical protein